MTVRQEVLSCIEALSDEKIEALRPLLLMLADAPFAVETNLDAEEKAFILQGRAEYAANPDSFISLDSVR